MLGIEIKIFFISGGRAFPYALGLRASMFIPLRDLLPSIKGGERKLARSEKRREKDQVCDKVEGNSSKQQNSPILGVQIISIKRLLWVMCAHSQVIRTIFFLRIPRIVQFLALLLSRRRTRTEIRYITNLFYLASTLSGGKERGMRLCFPSGIRNETLSGRHACISSGHR